MVQRRIRKQPNLQRESDECDGDAVDEPDARQAARTAGREILEERRDRDGQPHQGGGVGEREPADLEGSLAGDVDSAAGPLAGPV